MISDEMLQDIIENNRTYFATDEAGKFVSISIHEFATELLASHRSIEALQKQAEEQQEVRDMYAVQFSLQAERITEALRESRRLRDEVAELQKKLDAANEENDKLTDKIWQVDNWCEAYPLDIFPEPDFKEVRRLLEAGGITVDSVSASNMRHVLKGIREILHEERTNGNN